MHGWSNALKDWPADARITSDVRPTNPVTVFRSVSGETMRWGLINSKSREFSTQAATFNARIEGLETTWSFKDAWHKNQRCLIPMYGYYEWPVVNGVKVKHFVTDKSVDGFVVAGLWEEWGQGQLSSTMITRTADDYMAQVHPKRMLCYLTPETAASWMAGEMSKDELEALELPNVIFYPDEAHTLGLFD